MSDADKEYADHLERAHKLLPAWFVSRMMFDEWHFALALVDGRALYCEHIDDVRMAVDGTVWIDAQLHSQEDADRHYWKFKPKTYQLVGSPTRRHNISINANHIMFVIEMADT